MTFIELSKMMACLKDTTQRVKVAQGVLRAWGPDCAMCGVLTLDYGHSREFVQTQYLREYTSQLVKEAENNRVCGELGVRDQAALFLINSLAGNISIQFDWNKLLVVNPKTEKIVIVAGKRALETDFYRSILETSDAVDIATVLKVYK